MRPIRSIGCLALLSYAVSVSAQDTIAPKLAEEIRREATRSQKSDAGRPLPLAAHWNVTGMYLEGFTPAYQLQLLKKGHHILPWLEWPPTDRDIVHNFQPNDPRRQKYIDARLADFEKNLAELARLKLPISFLATQWESILTYDKEFFGLPADKNPNVIGLDGKIKGQVCPMGPLEPWREVGRMWTDNFFMKRIQEIYPDPPLVLLISNNEHSKLQWSEAEQSQRYLDKYGKGKSGDFKRKVVADGWIERYSAMIDSMRAGFVSKTWKKNVRFIGYEAFPPVHFGRWGGWKEYSLYAPGQLDPQPLVWDGGSPSYYLHNWMALTDFTLWSPQVETMNWVFMLDEIHKTRPEFWFELSTWDGDQPGAGNDKRKFYARQGQLFTPKRYEGMVQYGMWLTRPRTVRDFRSHTESVVYAGPYFQAILDPVDRVWSEPVLQMFWRHGELVANPRGQHPYQADIPREFKNANRWFLLETSLTPKELAPTEFDNAKPPSRMTEISIYSLALVLGRAPEREWLVYAHAPREARTGVAITVPEFGPITVDVPQSGSFFHVIEKTKQVREVVAGGPASFHLQAPRFVEAGEPARFSVSEKFCPGGKIDTIAWNFGDDQVLGDMATHRFAKPGQYLVSVTGKQAGKDVVSREIPVMVGMKKEPGVVCRLLMKGALREGMQSWIWHGGWDKASYTFIPDASGNGNIGFLAGGAWVKDDARGLVLELNGQHDRVEISNTADINTGAAYPNRTVAFWFKAAAEPAAKPAPGKQKVHRQVLYEEGGPGSGINLYLDGDTLHAGAWVKGAGNWLQAKLAGRTAWQHVALVLRSADKNAVEADAELYLNGAKVAEGKAPVVGQHVADINLGRSGNTLFHDRQPGDNPGYYFAGRLDDFRIANRAFSANEVKELAR